MQGPPEISPRRELLILDTGPIRELVIFHAVSEFGFNNLRENLRHIKDQDAYKKCGQFISSFRGKTTSASVVAELHYWIRGTDQHGRLKLWNRVYEEFRNMGMDEEVVRLLDMQPDLVERFGPVDMSLIEIARRRAGHILTVDSPLHGQCKKAGLQVFLIQDVTQPLR